MRKRPTINWLLQNKLKELTIWIDRSLLWKHCKPTRKDSTPFLVTDNSVLSNIKEIINKHWYILNIESSFKELCNISQLMIAFCKIDKLKTTYRKKHNTKEPKIFHTYTTNNGRSMYPMLHQSIALLPASSQNSNIYNHSNQKHFYNFSTNHLP